MNRSAIMALSTILLWACSAQPPSITSAAGGASSTDSSSSVATGQGGMGGSGGALGAGGATTADLDCDVVKDDCPELIALSLTESYTIYFPAVVDGKDIDQFSAVGTTPQLSVGAVTIGLDDPPGMAHITVTANVAGSASLTVTLWYGENKEVERLYAFEFELSAG